VIILDTNVISELMRASPDARVLAWLNAFPLTELATCTVVLAELELGLAMMPAGERRRKLSDSFVALVRDSFSDRIYGLDQPAVPHYAAIGSHRKSIGRVIDTADLMIAAIAASRGFSLCTRNVTDFEHCGIPLLNPWQS
jgi:toxin FitB